MAKVPAGWTDEFTGDRVAGSAAVRLTQAGVARRFQNGATRYTSDIVLMGKLPALYIDDDFIAPDQQVPTTPPDPTPTTPMNPTDPITPTTPQIPANALLDSDGNVITDSDGLPILT